MKTRTKKGKTPASSKAAPAKKGGPEKKTSSRVFADKKGRPSVKRSEKSSDSLKGDLKTHFKVRKNSSEDLSPSAKEMPASKLPQKSAGVKAKTIKKKVTALNTVRETKSGGPSKAPPSKTSPTPKKSSPGDTKKITQKTKGRKAAGRKKLNALVLTPLSPGKKRKIGSATKGPEKINTFRGKDKKTFENVSRAGLPEEYGENELIVMAVDPNVVFVDWEIKKEKAAEAHEGFTMRVFDVTGNESLRISRDFLFDLKIEGRVGSGFFELGMPGREVKMEIGLYDNGRFLPILRSLSVSMPRLPVSDKLGIAKKIFGPGMPIGY